MSSLTPPLNPLPSGEGKGKSGKEEVKGEQNSLSLWERVGVRDILGLF
jgi:hypothetical protein